MPVQITKGVQINNKYPNMNKKQKGSAIAVIHKLDYADIWRGPGTLKDNNTMRIDMQGVIPHKPYNLQNLQVQVDNVKGDSTVSHANVSCELQTNDKQNQKGVENKVKTALNKSLDDGYSYNVTGSIP